MNTVQTINIYICYCCCCYYNWCSKCHQHTRRLAVADEYATDSLPHRWYCDPSRITPRSVALGSGWRHVNTHVLLVMLETAIFDHLFL